MVPSPTTWTPARVPTAGDRVSVEHPVTYDALSSAALDCARIQPSGRLVRRTDTDTRLVVGTLLVRGRLEIGSAAASIRAGATAEVLIADSPLLPA